MQTRPDTDVQRSVPKGLLYSLGGTALVSTNFVTAKYGLKGFNPETFSLVWTGAAAFYSLVVVLASGQWRQMALPRSAAGSMGLMGLATGAGMLLSWAGLARLDPSFAAFLWRFAPVLAIMLGVLLLGERMAAKEIVPVGVMIVGSFASSIGRWHVVGIGTTLTLIACFAVAVQMLIAKARARQIPASILVVYRVGIAAVVITFWGVLTGKLDFHVEASYWYITLLGAFLGPCLSFLLTFRSYRYWDLSRSSVVRTAQPLFVLPLAYLVFGKLPTGKELLGGCLIVVGAFWLAWMHFIRK